MTDAPDVRELPTHALMTGAAFALGRSAGTDNFERRVRLARRAQEIVDELGRRLNAQITPAVCDCPHETSCSHYMPPDNLDRLEEELRKEAEDVREDYCKLNVVRNYLPCSKHIRDVKNCERCGVQDPGKHCAEHCIIMAKCRDEAMLG